MEILWKGSFRIVLGNLSKTIRKLFLATKFPHRESGEITIFSQWQLSGNVKNCSILYSSFINIFTKIPDEIGPDCHEMVDMSEYRQYVSIFLDHYKGDIYRSSLRQHRLCYNTDMRQSFWNTWSSFLNSRPSFWFSFKTSKA